MQEENLNLSDMRKATTLKALNKFHKVKLAAQALGITERMLLTWRRDFGIVKVDGYKYISVQ